MSVARAPGYSIDLTDASKIASRCRRGLGGPVRIDFKLDEGNENLFTKWYRGRSDKLVRAMQLRREREGPYFHQFIVFELQNNGGLFRIDRRLRPDEHAPRNCLRDEGIQAFDTIEPVIAWGDPLFVASDCLVSIEFKVDVPLALILKVCHRIHFHPLAKVYTLQRYNCYFFAQTILSCVACGISDWRMMGDEPWLLGNGAHPSQSKRQGGTLNLYHGSIGPNTSGDQYLGPVGYPSAVISAAAARFTFDWSFLYDAIQDTFASEIHPGTRTLVHGIARELQPALEEYWNGERDTIRKMVAMNSWTLILQAGLWDTQMKNQPKGFIKQIPLEALKRWDSLRDHLKPRGNPPQRYIGSLKRRNSTTQSMFNLENESNSEVAGPTLETLESFQSPSTFTNAGDTRSRLLSELLQNLDYRYAETWDSLYTECIREAAEQALQVRLHSFEQNMIIRINYKIMHDGYQETEALEHDLGNVPQYTTPRSTTLWRRKAKQEPDIMTESTIVEMQEYLVRLIEAHSVRVEEYKWLTKANATDVARDVTEAMNEVWTALIE